MPDTRHDRLLILDIDETLIYGTETELHRPADFCVGPYYVYRRPHLAEFLNSVGQWYELALWSSATIDYVSQIAHEIRPERCEWTFVWGRDRCTRRMHPELMETIFIKDLKKVKRLGYDVRRVLVVDDSPEKTSRNFGNAIYMQAFEGSEDDRELPRLQAYLESIRHAEDYRTIEKRGWRSRAQRP
jgi:TFIIF-interacting CTD phosphatase-like protein